MFLKYPANAQYMALVIISILNIDILEPQDISKWLYLDFAHETEEVVDDRMLTP